MMCNASMLYDVSIIVASYNPTWIKLKRTLLSILMQQDVLYEVIVADDGSVIDFFEASEELFVQYGFEAYRLLKSNKNEGTVKNVYKALEIAKGEYIKLISPADYLVSETEMARWLRWSRSKKTMISAGRSICYTNKESTSCVIKTRARPRNLWLYTNKGIPTSWKVADYLYLIDPFNGPDFLVNKKLLRAYLKEIMDKGIIYVEDYSYRLMLLDGITISHYPHNVCFYEYGTGNSTGGKKNGRKPILLDDGKKWNEIVATRKTYTRFTKGIASYYNNRSKGRAVFGMIRATCRQPFLIILWITKHFFYARSAGPIEEEDAFYRKVIEYSSKETSVLGKKTESIT